MNYQHLTRPFNPNNRIFILLGLIALALSVVAVLLIGPRHFLTSARDFVFAPTVQSVAPIVVGVPNPDEQATEHRATELTQLLHRHWENSMLAVEMVNVKNVTILEFHPDFASEKILLRGEAKEFDALNEYIRQLNATGLVQHIALMHEQAISRERVDTIEFELDGDLTSSQR